MDGLNREDIKFIKKKEAEGYKLEIDCYDLWLDDDGNEKVTQFAVYLMKDGHAHYYNDGDGFKENY